MLTGPIQSDDPDQLNQMMLEELKAQGVDLTQAMPVQPMLGCCARDTRACG